MVQTRPKSNRYAHLMLPEALVHFGAGHLSRRWTDWDSGPHKQIHPTRSGQPTDAGPRLGLAWSAEAPCLQTPQIISTEISTRGRTSPRGKKL